MFVVTIFSHIFVAPTPFAPTSKPLSGKPLSFHRTQTNILLKNPNPNPSLSPNQNHCPPKPKPLSSSNTLPQSPCFLPVVRSPHQPDTPVCSPPQSVTVDFLSECVNVSKLLRALFGHVHPTLTAPHSHRPTGG